MVVSCNDQAVANLASRLSNMSVTNGHGNGHVTAAVSRGNGKKRRSLGRGRGSHYYAAPRPIPVTHQAEAPTAAGTNIPVVNDRISQPQSSLGVSKSRGRNDPLTIFHPFPHLPAELRLQIWRAYMNEGRLIEIEHGRNPEDESAANLNHYVHRVSRRSRIPPSIIHINKEAREDALKKYKKVQFGSRGQNDEKYFIYYNPATDILYFGDNACISTTIHLFQMAYEKNIDIPRVAINATGRFTACCNWDAEDDYDVAINTAVWGGCNIPQALHGISAKVHNEEEPIITGCPGLEHVLFVQPSMFWPVEPGNVDSFVGFRPAVGDGITPGQKRFKESMLHMIEGVQNDIKLRGVGQEEEDNNWTGDKKPTFSFVSLAPRQVGVDRRVYDAMVIKGDEFRKLSRGRDRAIIDRFSTDNKCFVTWCKYDYRMQLEREIGFFGLREDIENLKVVVKERLKQVNKVFMAKEE